MAKRQPGPDYGYGNLRFLFGFLGSHGHEPWELICNLSFFHFSFSFLFCLLAATSSIDVCRCLDMYQGNIRQFHPNLKSDLASTYIHTTRLDTYTVCSPACAPPLPKTLVQAPISVDPLTCRKCSRDFKFTKLFFTISSLFAAFPTCVRSRSFFARNHQHHCREESHSIPILAARRRQRKGRKIKWVTCTAAAAAAAPATSIPRRTSRR